MLEFPKNGRREIGMTKESVKKDIEAQLYFISLKKQELQVKLAERPVTLAKVEGFYTNLEQLNFVDSKIITVPESISKRMLSEELQTLRNIISLEKGVKISYRRLAKLERDEKVILE